MTWQLKRKQMKAKVKDNKPVKVKHLTLQGKGPLNSAKNVKTLAEFLKEVFGEKKECVE